MKRSMFFYAAMAAIGVCGWGCTESINPIAPAPPAEAPVALYLESPCGEQLQLDLMTRTHEYAGLVTVANDESVLEITLDTRATGWLLTKTQIVVSPPSTRGNGRTPVSLRASAPSIAIHRPALTQWDYSVPLADLGVQPGDVLSISVRATVQMQTEAGKPAATEQAWVASGESSSPASATYFTYGVQACVVPEPASMTVVYPNGGEFVCAGWTIPIRWTCTNGGPTVLIELLWGDEVCTTIASAAPNTGTYNWQSGPCSWETLGYAVRVTDTASGAHDESDATFEIAECE